MTQQLTEILASWPSFFLFPAYTVPNPPFPITFSMVYLFSMTTSFSFFSKTKMNNKLAVIHIAFSVTQHVSYLLEHLNKANVRMSVVGNIIPTALPISYRSDNYILLCTVQQVHLQDYKIMNRLQSRSIYCCRVRRTMQRLRV